MSDAELEALHVLARGMASRAPFTKADPTKGIHAINGGVANRLVEGGYARAIPHWNAVEITDKGRRALARSAS